MAQRTMDEMLAADTRIDADAFFTTSLRNTNKIINYKENTSISDGVHLRGDVAADEGLECSQVTKRVLPRIQIRCLRMGSQIGLKDRQRCIYNNRDCS